MNMRIGLLAATLIFTTMAYAGLFSFGVKFPSSKFGDQLGKSKIEFMQNVGINLASQNVGCGKRAECKAFSNSRHLPCFSEQIEITTTKDESKATFLNLQFYNVDRCQRQVGTPTFSEIFKEEGNPTIVVTVGPPASIGITTYAMWISDTKMVRIGSLCRAIGNEKGKSVYEAFRNCRLSNIIVSECNKEFPCTKIEDLEKVGTKHSF